MSTRLTGYNNTITADDVYVLACADPMNRRTTLYITLTPIGGYDGVIAVQQRALRSSQAFQTANYAKPPGAGVAQAPFAGPATIEVDATAMDTALVTSGRTVGQLQIDVAVSDQY